MKRIDLISLLFLFIGIVFIFYPVFSAEYLYTDDANQIWLAKQRLNFNTSIPQGRYITYKTFECLYRYINTIHQVIYARLFSLSGWILCLPIWYFIIKKVISKNNLPAVLVQLSMVYIICMPPFAIYIGWAACMQMFIACTFGLVAGYTLYTGIKFTDNMVHVPTSIIALSLLFGIASLFTYQNGFGCFFIPFFIDFISGKKFTKNIYIGIVLSLLTYGLYYLIFKYSIHTYATGISERTAITTNPINKLLFLFGRPLATAFHFTCLFNEKSMLGLVVYCLVLAAWLGATVTRQKPVPLSQKAMYLLGLVIFFILIYLPSLIVKENYSSNRTLFALDVAVFFLVTETLFTFFKKDVLKYIVAGSIAILFLGNGWYNFNKQFLNPVAEEYSMLKKFITQHYQPGTLTINFICPAENSFEKKYGLTTSWDEFGVPSTAKKWVPEPLIKQLVFEQTGNRQTAEKLIVKSWVDKAAFENAADTTSKGVLLIDMEEMIAH